jgi:uncharacterized protein
MELNPFLITGYVSPEYFCDREKETAMITEAVTNRRHLTLFSPRRYGKTALIKHVFHLGEKKKLFIPVYTDIMATTNLPEFVENFGKSVLSAHARNTSVLKKMMNSLASIRPKFTIDALTGEPAVTLTVNNEKEAADSLEAVFNYLRNQKTSFVVSIDEFQQVSYYPEKNIEVLLRSYVQQAGNICIIFSGSRKHILTQMFSMADRPFYNSTQIMEIERIPQESYSSFVLERFTAGKRIISSDALEMIFEITALKTFYVQYLCNRLYSAFKKVDTHQVKEMLFRIINENEPVYAGYLNLLTSQQFRVLRAIALNNGIEAPTSKEFISGYSLGAASSASQSVKSLEDKEFIALYDKKYRVNDAFFMLWLIHKSL